MPRVPTYDNPQVAPQALPSVRLSAPDMPDVAGRQLQEAGGQLQRIGHAGGQVALGMQEQADQARVDDALNQVVRVRTDLSAQALGLSGRNALERPDGKSLAQEYTDKLQEKADEISAGLGNDAQRKLFARHSMPLGQQLYSALSQHTVAQQKEFDKQQRADAVSVAQKQGVLLHGVPGMLDQSRAAILRVAAAVEKENGWSAERDQTSIDALRQELLGPMHAGVIGSMLQANRSKDAGDYFAAHAGEMGMREAEHAHKSIREASIRTEAEGKATAIMAGSPVGHTFSQALGMVLKFEGGYVPNDAGKGPTNQGINQASNPDVDVRNMTPAQRDRIYKERYWNAIGADSLPPQIRAVAFDAAVNHGPSKANKLIAQADGDPQKLIELRRAEYQRLVRADPGKYGKFEKSWNARLNKLEAGLGSGVATLSGLLAQAEDIQDPQVKERAKVLIQDRFAQGELAAKEAYAKTLESAQDTAFSKFGGWQDVPPETMAALKPEDRARLMQGPLKASAPEVVFHLQTHPELWKPEKLNEYRALLTEHDYRTFYAKGTGPQAQDHTRAATIVTDQFNQALTQAGLGDLLGTKDENKKAQLYDLRAKFQRDIDAEQQRLNRSLSMEEKNALLNSLLKPVMVNMVRTGALFGNGPAAPEQKRAFEVQDSRSVIVPPDARSKIIADLQKRGIPVSERLVQELWLRME